MKNFIYTIFNFLILLSVLCLLFISCFPGRKTTAVYPFFQGDYLEYQNLPSDSSPRLKGILTSTRYEITMDSDDNFTVNFYAVNREPSGEMETFHLEKFSRTYDKYGRLLSIGGLDANKDKGNYCALWLPPAYRKKGRKFSMENYFKEKALVEDQTIWREHEVWKLKIYNFIYYYDINNGILIGIDDKMGKHTLLTDSRLQGDIF